MKKIALLILISFLVIPTISRAKKWEAGISDRIQSEMQYPDFALQQNIEGYVLVSFLLNQEGNIEIQQMNASDLSLGDYVISKLSKIHFDKREVSGEVFHMKFRFTIN